MIKRVLGILGGLLFCYSCTSLPVAQSRVGYGWSQNSVNTVIFRNQALCSFKDLQFTAFYNASGALVLGKRTIGDSKWELSLTPFKANVKDAHNAISMAVDTAGYLHLSWDMHDTPLQYAKSKSPLSLTLGEQHSMTGIQESKVTYPEFQNLADGSLLFLYRSGASGRGNLVVNRYEPQTGQWTQLHRNLIDGQGIRSAYWQTHVDDHGIHLSWTWRESWDVTTNHDIAYMVSKDGGYSWQDISGKALQLPITKDTAPYAWRIPENSNLMNQTSMTTDSNGNPYIASYWRERAITQYKVVYHKNQQWQLLDTDFREEDFELGGGGTKSIPISRPEILVDDHQLHLLFRDSQRGSKITLASYGFKTNKWDLKDLTNTSVGAWEPNFDKGLWKRSKKLHIFSQNVSQIDGEGLDSSMPAQEVVVLEVDMSN